MIIDPIISGKVGSMKVDWIKVEVSRKEKGEKALAKRIEIRKSA